MKKLTIIIAFLFVASGAFAQKGFNFGLNLSPLISFAKWDSAKKEINSLDSKSRLGFKGGLMINYGFAENVGFQTGLNVLLAGFTTETKQTTTMTNKYSITAVEIPLLLKMRTNDLGSGIHAKGYFGGSFALNVGAKVDASETTILYSKGKNSITNHFQPLLAWFAFGAGVDWDLEGIGTLDLALTYHLGLTNAIKPNYKHTYEPTPGVKVDIKPYDNLRARLSYIGLNIGFWFPTGN